MSFSKPRTELPSSLALLTAGSFLVAALPVALVLLAVSGSGESISGAALWSALWDSLIASAATSALVVLLAAVSSASLSLWPSSFAIATSIMTVALVSAMPSPLLAQIADFVADRIASAPGAPRSGIIAACVQSSLRALPFAMLLVFFRCGDLRRSVEAAINLGLSPARVCSSFIPRVLAPSLTKAFLMTFAIALGAGAGLARQDRDTQLLIDLIISHEPTQSISELSKYFVRVGSGLLAVITVLLLVTSMLIPSRTEHSVERAGIPGRCRIGLLGYLLRPFAHLPSIVLLCVLITPLALALSFSKEAASATRSELLGSLPTSSFIHELVICLSSAAIATAIGAVAAFRVQLLRYAPSRAILVIVFVPLLIPEVALAEAWAIGAGPLWKRVDSDIFNGVLFVSIQIARTAPLVYLLFCIHFVATTLVTEEAAINLGTPWTRAFLMVTVWRSRTLVVFVLLLTAAITFGSHYLHRRLLNAPTVSVQITQALIQSQSAIPWISITGLQLVFCGVMAPLVLTAIRKGGQSHG